MRLSSILPIAAVAAVVLASGNVPLQAGGGLILTMESASASLSLNDMQPPKRASKRELAERIRKLEMDRKGTYIDEMLENNDSSLSRWPDRVDRFVMVWVSPSPEGRDGQDPLYNEVQQAFFEWQRVGIPVRFGFVGDSADADVHVGWTDRFEEPISGSTRWARDQNWWIASGAITIALHGGSGQRLSPTAVRAITLHEVGHLLGLDHTSDTLSIMAPRVRVKSLSDADRATMLLLYSVPAGALRE